MKKLYVVGNKVSKSLSPTIFNYWFKKYNIKASYGYLELTEKNFHRKIKEVLEKKDTLGLNVTIPFKNKIINHLGKIDAHAKKIGAVNCVTNKKTINGTNTDWTGYYKTLPNIKKTKNRKVIILGYGGASHAIHYVLKKRGFKDILIFNRSKKKIKYSKNTEYTKKYSDLETHLEGVFLIINTTPINPMLKKHLKLITKSTIVSDIVYSPKNTSFLKQFPKNKKIYGISMLIEQAKPCFKMWFGKNPSVDAKMLNAIYKKI